MPWQAHLFVGERLRTYADIRRVCDLLHIPHSHLADDMELEDADVHCDEPATKTVTIGSETFSLRLALMIEREGGDAFPVDPKELATGNPHLCDYTCALFGYELTSRYSPSILDRRYEHGAPEPFEINLEEAAIIVRRVYEWWPDAQLLMLNIWH